jgi:hypothetical protein
MKTTRCTFPTSLLREGEAIGADERGEIGGDFRGDFLEFIARGIAGQLKALGGNVGSDGDDGTVARVRSGGTCEFVERLPGSFEVVDADIKNDVRAHWFTPHEKAARAILLIGLGKNAADAESALGKRGTRRETANIVAGFYESPDDVF